MSRALGLSVGLLAWCFTFSAWAVDVQRAVQLYREGFSFYSRGQYKRAVGRFRKSRELLPKLSRYHKTRAELDRLIGLSYYRLRKFQKAYELLDVYLRSPFLRRKKVPEVKRIWLELRSRLSLVVRRRVIPPRRRVMVERRRRVPPPPRRPGGLRPHPMAWAMTGIGVLTVGAAVLVGVVAQQNMNDVRDKFVKLQNAPNRNAQSISMGAREALTQSTVSNALYIGGGVLAATGTLLLFTWNTSPPPPR